MARPPIVEAAEAGDDDAQAWLNLADEVNDGSPTDLTMDDFEPAFKAAAERAARKFDLPWPPSVGDFERALGY